MGKIKDLPMLERPREKAIRNGFESLSNIELLSILIGSGTKEQSALEIASSLLVNFKGLSNLSSASHNTIIKVKGLKKSKVCRLCAAFELSKRIKDAEMFQNETSVDSNFLYKKYHRHAKSEIESFSLVSLDRKKRIIYEETPHIGVEDNVPISISHVLSTLLVHKSKYFYVLHNHPSGNVLPSNSDIELTSKLIVEAKKLNIKLIDHLIITDDCYYSFKDHQVHKVVN